MISGHVDASQGVTEEAWLGALVDAGASLQGVQAAVDTLGIGGVRFAYAQVTRNGDAASMVRVRAPVQTPVVRTWGEMRDLLEFAAIDQGVRDNAAQVLRLLADVEAGLTGEDLDDVHLHEVAAVTMITDVVGTCAAMADLGLQAMTVGRVAAGTGRVRTALGDRDLPDPLVVRLLDGFETAPGAIADADVTTPVGAALLAHFCEPASPDHQPIDGHVGRGAGPKGTRLTIHVAA